LRSLWDYKKKPDDLPGVLRVAVIDFNSTWFLTRAYLRRIAVMCFLLDQVPKLFNSVLLLYLVRQDFGNGEKNMVSVLALSIHLVLIFAEPLKAGKHLQCEEHSVIQGDLFLAFD
jgi:hypothetical protein